MQYYAELRYAILLAINTLKYKVGRGWDPFHTFIGLGHPTWMKLCLLLILFLVFPFISIKIPLPLVTTTHSVPTSSAAHILLLQFGQLSAPLAFALMAAALVFPQPLFWYAFPIFVIISSCFSLLIRFVNWLHALLTTIPVLNVMIRATIVGWQAFGIGPQGPQTPETEPIDDQFRNPQAVLVLELVTDGIDDQDLEAAAGVVLV